jgi:hypothetical protein
MIGIKNWSLYTFGYEDRVLTLDRDTRQQFGYTTVNGPKYMMQQGRSPFKRSPDMAA